MRVLFFRELFDLSASFGKVKEVFSGSSTLSTFSGVDAGSSRTDSSSVSKESADLILLKSFDVQPFRLSVSYSSTESTEFLSPTPLTFTIIYISILFVLASTNPIGWLNSSFEFIICNWLFPIFKFSFFSFTTAFSSAPSEASLSSTDLAGLDGSISKSFMLLSFSFPG